MSGNFWSSLFSVESINFGHCQLRLVAADRPRFCLSSLKAGNFGHCHLDVESSNFGLYLLIDEGKNSRDDHWLTDFCLSFFL